MEEGALILGLSLIVVGAVIYLSAAKIPPNPFIGFRIGYSYVSREVWTKLLKVSSLGILVLGILSLIIGWLYGTSPSALITGVGSIIMLVLLLPYARIIAEKEQIRKPAVVRGPTQGIPKLTPNPVLPSLVLAVGIASLIHIAINYWALPKQLPAHYVPFNPYWVPDIFAPKHEIVMLMTSVNALIIGVTLLIYYLGWRRPEVLYIPWFGKALLRRAINIFYLLLAISSLTTSLMAIIIVQDGITGSTPVYLAAVEDSLLAALTALIIYLTWITASAYKTKKLTFK